MADQSMSFYDAAGRFSSFSPVGNKVHDENRLEQLCQEMRS
jgi:hypothetical protein